MSGIMETVSVRLEGHGYDVHIGTNILNELPSIINSNRQPSKIAVITNRVLAQKYGEPVTDILNAAGIDSKCIVMRAGETNKNLATVCRMYENFAEMGLDRRSAVVAVGGGVVCDVAGFVAATYLRGLDLYQVPTSLLAQVDASIGGKNGVDLPQGKNLVGSFYQPKAVLVDIGVLRSLPVREMRCGLAEVVKHGIIRDEAYFKYVRSRGSMLTGRNDEEMSKVVRRSVEIKAEIVELDERENGLRAILNFGHTIGHALEVVTDYKALRHGEAVAIGMITECMIAEKLGICNAGVSGELVNTLVGLRLPVQMDSTLSPEAIVEAMEFDKKTIAGKLCMALPVSIGSAKIIDSVSREVVLEAIKSHQQMDIHSAWM
jgi:3-dehydroquinate synthase